MVRRPGGVQGPFGKILILIFSSFAAYFPAGQGLTFDVRETEDGDRWGARLEIYESDPAQEPDMDKWVTDLAFRLAG
jgi:hypothetical protein